MNARDDREVHRESRTGVRSVLERCWSLQPLILGHVFFTKLPKRSQTHPELPGQYSYYLTNFAVPSWHLNFNPSWRIIPFYEMKCLARSSPGFSVSSSILTAHVAWPQTTTVWWVYGRLIKEAFAIRVFGKQKFMEGYGKTKYTPWKLRVCSGKNGACETTFKFGFRPIFRGVCC